jgi:hypothetical protein
MLSLLHPKISVGTLDFATCLPLSSLSSTIDISYAALQAHEIINVALHLEYSPGIIFIFFQGRNDLYHV